MENEQLDKLTEILEKENSLKESSKSKLNYVDIDSFQIDQPTVETQKASIENIFGQVSSYEVVCLQSGYGATMSALTYKDILTITNANVSSYEARKNLLNTIYKKIQKLSFCEENKKPKFDEWLKMTSYGDLETLLYGIYCATFQEKSSVNVLCPYCEKEGTISINNNELIQTEGNKAEISNEIDEISKNADSIDKVMDYSIVSIDEKHKKKNIKSLMLSKSKMVFNIKRPTMYEILDILKNMKEDVIASLSSDTFNMLLCTFSIYVKNKDNDKYFIVKNKNDIVTIINMLSVEDVSDLKQAIDNILEEKYIYYKIKKTTCPNCKKEIYNIPMDIESLLFFQISEKQLS